MDVSGDFRAFPSALGYDSASSDGVVRTVYDRAALASVRGERESWRGDAYGHLTSVYARVQVYQVRIGADFSHERGRPVDIENDSPRRVAVMSSEQKASAWAAVLNPFFHSLLPTFHDKR